MLRKQTHLVCTIFVSKYLFISSKLVTLKSICVLRVCFIPYHKYSTFSSTLKSRETTKMNLKASTHTHPSQIRTPLLLFPSLFPAYPHIKLNMYLINKRTKTSWHTANIPYGQGHYNTTEKHCAHFWQNVSVYEVFMVCVRYPSLKWVIQLFPHSSYGRRQRSLSAHGFPLAQRKVFYNKTKTKKRP